MVFAQTGKRAVITAMAVAMLLVLASPVSLASQMHTVRQGDTRARSLNSMVSR